MKKRLGKLLSLALAVLMLVSVFSMNAFAFSNEYVTVECPEGFDVTDMSETESFYVNLWYDEWYTADDGDEYYTGNNVDLYITVALEDEVLEDYDYGEEYFETLEWYINGTMNRTEIKYEKIGGYDALVYEMYYDYENLDSNLRVTGECLYSEVIIITDNCVVDMYVDVIDAKDLVAYRNETVETFMGAISYNESAILESRAESEKLVSIIGAVAIGVVAVIAIVVIVVIVVVVKSSKKKKAQRMAQQPQYNFDPRTGQPIQNNQPWQYNPYGQQPTVNNNQNNPYGQQGGQYTPYTPYTPQQPAASETKDPLDLDNK